MKVEGISYLTYLFIFLCYVISTSSTLSLVLYQLLMMVFIKISGIDAEDMPKGFEGQRADKSDEDEGMEDEGQDENRHR